MVVPVRRGLCRASGTTALRGRVRSLPGTPGAGCSRRRGSRALCASRAPAVGRTVSVGLLSGWREVGLPGPHGCPLPIPRKSFSLQAPDAAESRAADVALREAGGWRLSRRPRRGFSGNASPKEISAGLALASRHTGVCQGLFRAAEQQRSWGGSFLMLATWMGGLRLRKGRSSPPRGKSLVFSCRALTGRVRSRRSL